MKKLYSRTRKAWKNYKSKQSTDEAHVLSLDTSAKETGWNVLKRVFEIVRDGSDLFLPLKAALAGVVAIMEEVEVYIIFI